MDDSFPQPVVVISGCLDFEACRYNAQLIPFDLVGELEPFVRYVPICPEVEIGLGVPREPIRLVQLEKSNCESGSDPEVGLVQPATGVDVTRDMLGFSSRFLSSLDEVDGFILKNRSPSCGIHGVKVYHGPESSSTAFRSPGLFAGRVVETHPGLAIEDEERLRNYRIRGHFLTKLFALAALRNVEKAGRMSELGRFHARYKLVLIANNQSEMRALGRTVANPERLPFEQVMAAYREHFGHALRQAPRYTAVVNVLEHGAGYFKDRIGRREKSFFRSQLQRYREGRAPLSAVASLIHSWAVRFEEEYLLDQAFFQPYPGDLMSVSDSGKGRARRA
jgi:uncharacterized protein YbgA (DUF1722 family)/uncharacterized protein YbbK (DUF523 family)